MNFRCVRCNKELDINIKNGKVKKGAPITILCDCKCGNRIIRKKNGKIILIEKKQTDYSA